MSWEDGVEIPRFSCMGWFMPDACSMDCIFASSQGFGEQDMREMVFLERYRC